MPDKKTILKWTALGVSPFAIWGLIHFFFANQDDFDPNNLDLMLQNGQSRIIDAKTQEELDSVQDWIMDYADVGIRSTLLENLDERRGEIATETIGKLIKRQGEIATETKEKTLKPVTKVPSVKLAKKRATTPRRKLPATYNDDLKKINEANSLATLNKYEKALMDPEQTAGTHIIEELLARIRQRKVELA